MYLYLQILRLGKDTILQGLTTNFNLIQNSLLKSKTIRPYIVSQSFVSTIHFGIMFHRSFLRVFTIITHNFCSVYKKKYLYLICILDTFSQRVSYCIFQILGKCILSILPKILSKVFSQPWRLCCKILVPL